MRFRFASLHSPTMTSVRIPAAGYARVLSNITLWQGGRRECRVLHPHPQPCVRRMKAHKNSHHRLAETFRHSLRDGFTASFVLSPGTGLSCPRRLQDHYLASLISASGYQDHTTSPSATAPLVLRHHRRPSHPALHVRDDASAPPDERGTTVLYCCFYQTKKLNIFCSRAGHNGQISAANRWAD